MNNPIKITQKSGSYVTKPSSIQKSPLLSAHPNQNVVVKWPQMKMGPLEAQQLQKEVLQDASNIEQEHQSSELNDITDKSMQD